jgi:uncharacterized protein YndB with AHSA1/START domain
MSTTQPEPHPSPEPSAQPTAQPTRSIQLEVTVGATADAVWSALTDPAELARWFPPMAKGSSGVGEKLLISWGPGMEWWTTVTVAEPGHHVQWVDDPAQPLVVDWRITGAGGTTSVRLVHAGWSASSDWDEQYDATKAGWTYFLFNLRHYLERHRGTPRRMVCARRPTRMSRTAAWERLMGPEGFAMADADRARLRSGARAALHLGDEALPLEVAHCASPTHLWGRLPALNNGLLFVEMECGHDEYHCGLWLSAYGLAAERTATLDSALSALADRVFGPAPSAGSP